jgi:hypothetical protein
MSALKGEECDCWFQQDEMTANTGNSTMEMLQEFFGDLLTRVLQRPLNLLSPDFTFKIILNICT